MEKQYPNVDTENDEQMAQAILRITAEVQSFLNKSFDIFCDKFLNIRKGHKFDIKQEIIGRNGLWVAKKRYSIWITNENGVPKDEIMYKGLDVVRSSYPAAFKDFLKELLTDILKNVPQDKIDDRVVDFKNHVMDLTIEDIAIPTAVKNLTKYGTKRTESSKIYGNWIKGSPAHVKAALSYNEFLEYHHLENKFAKLSNGEKIKWAYLKDNSFGINAMAMRGYDDPFELIQFIEKYIDKNKIFERLVERKIKDFYDALGWDIPSAKQKIINTFFDF